MSWVRDLNEKVMYIYVAFVSRNSSPRYMLFGSRYIYSDVPKKTWYICTLKSGYSHTNTLTHTRNPHTTTCLIFSVHRKAGRHRDKTQTEARCGLGREDSNSIYPKDTTHKRWWLFNLRKCVEWGASSKYRMLRKWIKPANRNMKQRIIKSVVCFTIDELAYLDI